ncbi:ParB/RepB/Spo0J family partition protein [Clostridium paridis]|uniref:ParB N-terminal domain-containing protein n=1 Tax=Clostridium paridis TaxID=2803863 RepID=A0A937K5M7_9CLOT|nr:ParB/Srx family N-terminal domain-containing protein [Clostridium paridis]MBL4933209.1 ParB N-terminal domain-containing protein [Clostridium paridis]
MESQYQEISIDEIQLDFENPRISKFLEQYSKDQLTSEAISLALGGGSDDKNGTSYGSLKESIKSNQGIIHPIIVNKTHDEKYIVIEGNTRVQIYKEFNESHVPGSWNKIRSIVYNDLSDSQIHAIRLQAHLVGPREWDPYSKAKYLNYLSNQEKLPIQQIISFCGGRVNEIKKFIDAFNDMEKYYRGILSYDSEFDQREFSKFMELQNRSVKDALVINKYNRNDFAKWVINGNVDTAQNVRKLPAIIKNDEAMKVFLKSNITEAVKVLAIEEFDTNSLSEVPYEHLAVELTKRLRNIKYQEVKNLKYDPRYEEKKEILFDVLEELDAIIKEIKEE